MYLSTLNFGRLKMKIKFKIQPDNDYLWECFVKRDFNFLKSALFKFNKTSKYWNGYFIFIYPVAIYIQPKDKLPKQNYNWILSTINNTNRWTNTKLKEALEKYKEFKKQ